MSPQPEYTGMDKYPGIIATVVTIAITAIFLGALAMGTGHHEEAHDAGSHTETPAGEQTAH